MFILLEKGHLLKIFLVFDDILEVTVSFNLIIEKSLQINASLVVDEVYHSQSFADIIFTYSCLFQAVIDKFAFLGQFFQFLSDNLLSFCLIVD